MCCGEKHTQTCLCCPCVQLLEAEMAKVKSEKDHQDATLTYNDLAKRTATLEKQLKRNIKKAR